MNILLVKRFCALRFHLYEKTLLFLIPDPCLDEYNSVCVSVATQQFYALHTCWFKISFEKPCMSEASGLLPRLYSTSVCDPDDSLRYCETACQACRKIYSRGAQPRPHMAYDKTICGRAHVI